jgi:phosphoesterase, MJ0936 family
MTVIQAYNPDQIVLLGDYLYNGPRNGVPSDYDPMAVCDLLNVYANKIIGVRGNCDSRIDETLLRFKLDDSKIVFLNGYRCNLIHGDLLSGDLVTVTRGDILMFGHTHVFMLKQEDGLYYLNPGSTSFPKNGNPPTFALMEGRHIEIRSLIDGSVLASTDLR